MQTLALIAAIGLFHGPQLSAPAQLAAIDGFRRDFNAAKDAVRVVIILSPS